jgi:hypothetical protein
VSGGAISAQFSRIAESNLQYPTLLSTSKLAVSNDKFPDNSINKTSDLGDHWQVHWWQLDGPIVGSTSIGEIKHLIQQKNFTDQILNRKAKSYGLETEPCIGDQLDLKG